MILGHDLKPIAQPKEGGIYIATHGKTRKTFLWEDGKPVDLSNRHMRRAYIKRKLTGRSGLIHSSLV